MSPGLTWSCDPGATSNAGGSRLEVVVLADGIAGGESDGGEFVSEFGPGDYLGEIAVVTGARRSASVTTRTPARLLVFDAPAFRALLSRAPRVRRKVVSSAALRLASSS